MSNLSELLNIRNKNEDLEDQLASLSTENKTFKFSTSSDILSRVQAFLPQIQQANEKLQNEDTSKLNIEDVDENAEQYIEMNLGLGVYDTKKDDGDEDEDDSDSEKEETIKLPSDLPNSDQKPIIELMEKHLFQLIYNALDRGDHEQN
ncbi:hypothetical protein G6F56_000203 [Rhizopus delemar]|nr:hypothetical protein G6F56_000203 [Rhizopus delemar]